MRYSVKMTWDAEAAVWIATSDDIPGLVLESGSFDALIERVKLAAPELIRMNGTESAQLNIAYSMDRVDTVPVYG